MLTRKIRVLLYPASIALGATLVLSGCAPEISPTASSPISSKTPKATSVSTPTVSPSATLTDAPSTAITAGCSTLLSDEILEKTYPGYELNKAFSPAASSSGEKAISEKGVACQWISLNTGSTITISAAHLSPAALSKISSALPGASTSEFSTEAGFTGSFQTQNGVGMAQLVTNKFWITVDSEEFYTAADAAPIMSMLVAALEWDSQNS